MIRHPARPATSRAIAAEAGRVHAGEFPGGWRRRGRASIQRQDGEHAVERHHRMCDIVIRPQKAAFFLSVTILREGILRFWRQPLVRRVTAGR